MTGGGKGGEGPYEDPNYASMSDAYTGILSNMFLGGEGEVSPGVIGQTVASSVGGVYDPASETLTLPDGSKARYDVTSGTFAGIGDSGTQQIFTQKQTSGKRGLSTTRQPISVEDAIASGQTVYDASGNVVDPTKLGNTSSPLLDKANELAASYKVSLGDKASPWNAGQSLKAQTYDGATPDEQINKYGNDYFNMSYTPSEYKSFDYALDPVKSVSGDIDTAYNQQYQNEADQRAKLYNEDLQSTTDFIDTQGSSLKGGRAAALKNEVNSSYNTELNRLKDTTEADKTLTKYQEAKDVRNMQTARDESLLRLKGDENRYGQEFNTGEKQFGYQDSSNRYSDKMKSGLALEQQDFTNKQAVEQGNQAKTAQFMTFLDQLYGRFANQDMAAANYDVQQNQIAAGVLGDLFKGIGAAVPTPKG